MKYFFLHQAPDDAHDDIDSGNVFGFHDTIEPNSDESAIVVGVDIHDVELIEQPMVIFFYKFHGEIGEMYFEY